MINEKESWKMKEQDRIDKAFKREFRPNTSYKIIQVKPIYETDEVIVFYESTTGKDEVLRKYSREVWLKYHSLPTIPSTLSLRSYL